MSLNKITEYRINPVSILYKSIAGRYRPVRVADGPITARYRFIKNASWEEVFVSKIMSVHVYKFFLVENVLKHTLTLLDIIIVN